MNEFSNRIANLFQQHGYKKGDIVGLFMENRPEFVATWLGLSKIGVIVPLINTNQRQASLIHSIEIAKCQALIYGESLASGEFIFVFPSIWLLKFLSVSFEFCIILYSKNKFTKFLLYFSCCRSIRTIE